MQNVATAELWRTAVAPAPAEPNLSNLPSRIRLWPEEIVNRHAHRTAFGPLFINHICAVGVF